MKTKFNGMLTLLLALIVQFTFAQDKQISGTVSDETGPLPGVSVIIKGSSTGVETDFDGFYAITAKVGDILTYSYVGMESVTKKVGNATTMNIVMAGSNLLDEVIIVGYGTTTKKSFTGSVKTVKSEDLAVKSVSNISQALAGEVSGVTVINTSGQPGKTATIRIRGFGSVNGNRSPLYVVDGIPFSGDISSINPGDIASTTVLKDATATAIYGARGANGVILINTKTGKSNSSSVELDIKTGINVSLLPRYNTIDSPDKYIQYTWESLLNKGTYSGEANPIGYANSTLFSDGGINKKYNMWNVTDGSQLIDPATGLVRDTATRKYTPENWEDYGFQTSYRTEANLKLSGGSDDTRYFASFGYLEDEGYIINSNYTRYTTRLNVTHKVKDWLSGSANFGYAVSEMNDNGQSEDSGSIFWFVDNIPSIFPLYRRDDAGNIIQDPIYGGGEYDYGIGRAFGAMTNSIAGAHLDESKSKKHELNTNFSLNIKFSDKLSFENKFGSQYYYDRYHSLSNPFYGSAAEQGGSIWKFDEEMLTTNFLNLLRYKTTWGDNTIEVLAAHEANSWERKRSTASMEKMVHPGISDLNNFVVVTAPPTSYTDVVSIESYFGQVNYNLLDKYFVTGSIRRDGSSRFVKDKWGNFGSAGISWIASRESFLENVEIIDFLKVKVSYGLVGEQAGVGYYPGYNTHNVNNLNDEIAISPKDIGNPDLTWETSKMFQTGVEFSLGSFLDANIDYYIKNTENLLFDRRVGPSVGYAIQTVNDGELRNSGLEFDITTHIIKKDEFTLDLTFNGEFLKNELTLMPIDPSTEKEKILDQAGIYGRSKGHSLFDFYMKEWAGVDPSDGTPMWKIYYHDANANGMVDDGEAISSLTEYKNDNPNNSVSVTTTKKYSLATEKYIDKSAIPTVRGAFRLGGTYKDFNFGAQFMYSLGGYAYDYSYASLMHNKTPGNNNWHTDIEGRWQQPGDITNIPRLDANLTANSNSTSTRFITSTDFLSLNNITFGYTLPKKYLDNSSLSGINIWFSGDNLFIMSDKDGFNPTTAETGASDTYTYSPLSTFTIGVRAKF